MALELDREELVKQYLIYGIPKWMAEECADEEIAHRRLFSANSKKIVKKIDKDAVAYNRRIRERNQLNKAQIAFKKRYFASLPKSGRQYNHAKPVIDPHGTAYKTTSEMCLAWGVLLTTYCKRKAKGWTMVEALSGKHKKGRKKLCTLSN